MSDRHTPPWPGEDDTLVETAADIGEMPTLRWTRVLERAEPAPATLRWAPGAAESLVKS